jgi:hypothetical protein
VYGPRASTENKLKVFNASLNEWLRAGVWDARELLCPSSRSSTMVAGILFRLRVYYSGSGYTIPTDWLRPQRKEVLWAVVQGFEAPPGKSTQADWGRLGILSEAGRVRKR